MFSNLVQVWIASVAQHVGMAKMDCNGLHHILHHLPGRQLGQGTIRPQNVLQGGCGGQIFVDSSQRARTGVQVRETTQNRRHINIQVNRHTTHTQKEHKHTHTHKHTKTDTNTNTKHKHKHRQKHRHARTHAQSEDFRSRKEKAESLTIHTSLFDVAVLEEADQPGHAANMILAETAGEELQQKKKPPQAIWRKNEKEDDVTIRFCGSP